MWRSMLKSLLLQFLCESSFFVEHVPIQVNDNTHFLVIKNILFYFILVHFSSL